MRKFLAFFLLVTLTLSSVAMPVFTHVCNGMDQTWSSLFVPPSSCCTASASEAGKCKANATENQDCQLSKLPCCENEVSLAALGANYIPQIHSGLSFPSFVAIPTAIFSQSNIGAWHNTILQSIATDQCPTPRYGRSLLIFEQLFLC
jgi:hypothetical protein